MSRLRLLLLPLVLVVAAAAAAPAQATTLLPFPNDRYTVKAATETGRRIALPQDQMPRNRLGRPIDVTDLNRGDGFSPGQAILAKVPGLETMAAYRRSDLPPIDDPARSLRRDSPVVVLDATTGRRQLVWAELDQNPADPADRVLIVRPAKNFTEGHRIIVALRDLRTADGRAIRGGDPFRAAADPASVRRALSRAHVATGKDVFLAWDFTVASAKSTTGRMLSIRDRAFAQLGDTNLADGVVQGIAPTYTINPDLPDDSSQLPETLGEQDGIVDYADGPIRRKIRGKIVVPCFLDAPGCPSGSQFDIGADGLPRQLPGNTTAYDFTCNIPRREGKLRPSLYGHGLFGSQGEIDQGQLKDLSFERGFLFCAVDWNGMSFKDVPNAVTVLQDLSRFPTLVDHVEQGYLGFLYLGRLMVHPDGFAADPAFGGQIDTSALYYDGNSQGGIYGGALTAIAPDFRRAVLGVPGMNYSTLLSRSTDFDTYAQGNVEGAETPLGLYDNYPDESERQLVFGIMQMLWDRADPNGYAAHMTSDPLPNTPTHKVLLQVGFGDHQVADITTEVEARTIGAAVHRPLLKAGRPRFRDRPYPERPSRPYWGVPSLADGDTGSGVVMFDIGTTAPPPAGNIPNREGDDPHERPRRSKLAQQQKSDFLRPGGRIFDVCGGLPCSA